MKRRYFLIIIIMILSLFGNGCFSGSSSSVPVPGDAEPVVKLAREDLASRKGIDKDDITVVNIEPVDWPDASLGCPEPGKMYAQVITPGYRILLSYKKEKYKYHSDKENRVVYCDNRS